MKETLEVKIWCGETKSHADYYYSGINLRSELMKPFVDPPGETVARWLRVTRILLTPTRSMWEGMFDT